MGHRPTRFRQDQPLIESGEHPRSGRREVVAQVQLLGCDIKRIPWVTMPTEVTVIPRPVEPSITPYLIHLARLFNLEPTPQDVLLRFASDEPPTFPSFLHPPEEAEEQEHIPGPHALLLQMPFRSAGLSEYAPPSVVPSDGILPDIGVQVNSIPCVQATSGKVFNHLPDIDVAVMQVPVVNCRVVITGDGQRINRAIGENGAGAASIRTVEPFSAER